MYEGGGLGGGVRYWGEVGMFGGLRMVGVSEGMDLNPNTARPELSLAQLVPLVNIY